MRALSALTALLGFALTGTAAASPAPQEVVDDDEPGAPAPAPRIILPSPTLATRPGLDLGAPPAPDAKSPTAALALSLTGYLVPMAVGATMLFVGGSPEVKIAGMVTGGLGATFGPSLGHLYAGSVGRGLLTSLGRGGAITGAVFLIFAGSFPEKGSNEDAGLIAGGALLAAGAFALTLWDLIDAPAAARRANARHGFAVAPILGRDHAGATTGGLAVAGRF